MKRLLIFLTFVPSFLGAQVLLIPQGAAWDYFDQGNVGNVPWTDLGFSASNWSSGNAGFRRHCRPDRCHRPHFEAP